jgi:hypothetical protein
MPHLTDILQILGMLAVVIIMAIVVRARHKNKAIHDNEFAHENVCEHLRPVLAHLEAQGHQIRKAGQQHPELPLEIYLHPPFDPAAIFQQLKLEPPVYLSERNVLYCKEDWCELRPMK